MLTAEECNEDLIKILVKVEAGKRSLSKDTALIFAVLNQSWAVIPDLLVEAGCVNSERLCASFLCLESKAPQ